MGQVAGAGADFEDFIVTFDSKRLQDPAAQRRSQHALPVTQKNLAVHVRAVPIFFGYVAVAGNRTDDVQDALVEDVPGTDLLFDHCRRARSVFIIYWPVRI